MYARVCAPAHAPKYLKTVGHGTHVETGKEEPVAPSLKTQNVYVRWSKAPRAGARPCTKYLSAGADTA